MQQKLNGIPETLLIPLWARAIENKQPKPIIKSHKALEIMDNIDYDFSKFEKGWLSQVGVVIRTELFDNITKEFIEKYPNAVIINIGCGLDTRFSRIDNRNIKWYDLDLPEPIRIKKNFFQETDRYKMIAKSVFDYSWIDEIVVSKEPILIIAEGMLMYFTQEEVKGIINKLVSTFPKAEMLLEMITPTIVKNSSRHDTVGKLGVEFKLGITSGKEIENYNKNIEFLREFNYFDFHKDRWRVVKWFALIPAFRNRFNGRVVHLKF